MALYVKHMYNIYLFIYKYICINMNVLYVIYKYKLYTYILYIVYLNIYYTYIFVYKIWT